MTASAAPCGLTPARRERASAAARSRSGRVRRAVTLWALHPSLLVANTLDRGRRHGRARGAPVVPAHPAAAARPAHGVVPGLVRRLPPLHLLLRPLRPPRGPRLLRRALRGRLQAHDGPRVVAPARSAPTRWAGCSGSARPLPACLAAATLPFLFETSFTISGGNLFSTLAGEYAFSLSSRSRSSRSASSRGACGPGRGVVASAVALSLTLAAHVLPWLWALGGIAVLVGRRPAARRAARSPTRCPRDRAAPPRRVAVRSPRAAGLRSASRSRRGGSCPWVHGQSLRDLDGLRERRRPRAR